MVDEDGVTFTVGMAKLTTWLNTVALLVVKLLPAVGEYTATTLCVPTASALVVYAAIPPFNVTAEPAALPSMLNCTVPVGCAVTFTAATVAVIVTDCP
jgi:hypothetical protein